MPAVMLDPSPIGVLKIVLVAQDSSCMKARWMDVFFSIKYVRLTKREIQGQMPLKTESLLSFVVW